MKYSEFEIRRARLCVERGVANMPKLPTHLLEVVVVALDALLVADPGEDAQLVAALQVPHPDPETIAACANDVLRRYSPEELQAKLDRLSDHQDDSPDA